MPKKILNTKRNATYSTGMPSDFSGGVPGPDSDHPESDKH